jgi:DNA-directed RNA polymerase specialized sigma24 family protein
VNETAVRYLAFHEQIQYVRKVEEGDEQAFGVLYDHFSQAITGYVNGRLSNADDISDLAADCFAKAYSAVRDGKFDTRYSFYTFLRAIADNEIRHYLKQRYVKIAGNDSVAAYRPKLYHYMNHDGSSTRSWEEAYPSLSIMPAQDIEAVSWELLRIVLSNCLKPHHGLAFGFIRLLEWRPREIVEQLSDSSLSELSSRFYHDFAAWFPSARKPESTAHDHCPEFLETLERTVADVFGEPEYENLRGQPRKAGDVLLSEFYGTSPSASLSDWCDKVRNRARKSLRGDI